MKPSEIHQSKQEYMAFDSGTFRQALYQTIRRKKFVNHCNHKREEKLKKLKDSIKPEERMAMFNSKNCTDK